MRLPAFAAIACLTALAACDESALPPDRGLVRVQIGAVQPELRAARLDLRHGDGPSFTSPVPPPVLRMAGPNGSLEIYWVVLLVSDARLERVAGACDAGGADCLPLEAAAGAVTVLGNHVYAQGEVPNGEYAGVRVRLEDLDADDEADPVAAARVRALAAEIRGRIPAWPVEGTVQVTGTFKPRTGDARAFTVYLAGEGEVAAALSPMLPVNAGTPFHVQVSADAEKWFREANGSIMDLSAVNGQVVHLGERLAQSFAAHAVRSPH